MCESTAVSLEVCVNLVALVVVRQPPQAIQEWKVLLRVLCTEGGATSRDHYMTVT